MTTTLAPTSRIGSRNQAKKLAESITEDLTDVEVCLDLSSFPAESPSFLDEVVEQLVVLRGAARLVVVASTDVQRELIEDAAARREVSARVTVVADIAEA